MNQELLQDHLLHPRYGGVLACANAVAEESNPICGDQVRLMLRVEGGQIAGLGWLAYGCPQTLACASALAEMVHGKSVAEARRLTRQDLAEALGGLPARKQHAAALAWETLQSALRDLPPEDYIPKPLAVL